MPTRPRRPSNSLSFPLTATLHRTVRFAVVDDDTAGPIRVTGLAVPWATVVELNFWGDTVEFSRGSIDVAHPEWVPFLLDHADHAMGYGVSFTDAADGLEAVVEIPRGELVDADTARAVRQMGNGIRTALSIGALLETADQTAGDGDTVHYTVTAARLLELSSVLVPRFDDARIASIAATGGVLTMAMPATDPYAPAFPRSRPVQLGEQPHPDDDNPDDDGDDNPDDDTPPGDVNASAQRHPARPARPATTAGLPYQQRRGRSVDTSLAGVARRLAATGGDPRMVTAALADVTTADVPGLVRPQYVDELIGLLTMGTPAINAFRQGNLTSNPVVFPSWTTLPLVDKVTGEKVEIPSGDAVIGSKTITVDTYAGGNDVSVQTIDWASPPFLEAYFQACTEIYSRKIEAAFETGLATWATDLGLTAGSTWVDAIGAMIGAIAGKGLPGTPVILLSGAALGSLFTELAGSGAAGLFGVVNADFPLPRFIPAPFLPAGTIVGGMTGAAISFQNAAAPVRLRAVNVGMLGLDVGVYGYFAAAALYPAGLVKATAPAAPLGVEMMDAWTPGGDLLHDTPTATTTPTKSTTTTTKSTTSSS